MRTATRTMLVAAIALLALNGCAPEPPTPTSAPSASAIPNPSTEPLSEPTPLIDLSCDELVPADQLAALSATPLTSFGSSYRFANESRFSGIPYEYSLRQLQGTVCNWNNREPEEETNGNPNDAFTSLTVYLLPDASTPWSRYADFRNEFGLGLEEVGCNNSGSDTIVRCWWSGMSSDDTWIDMMFEGVRDFGSDEANVAKFSPLVDSITAQVTGAPRGPVWSVPASTIDVPVGCPGLLTSEMLGTAMSVAPDDFSYYSGYLGGPSFLFEIETYIGADACYFWTPQRVDDNSFLYAVLRGGQWAWEYAREGESPIASAEPVALTGLAEGDSAWMRESVVPAIDLIIGGNWITISTYDYELAALGLDRGALIRMAQGAVDELRN